MRQLWKFVICSVLLPLSIVYATQQPNAETDYKTATTTTTTISPITTTTTTTSTTTTPTTSTVNTTDTNATENATDAETTAEPLPTLAAKLVRQRRQHSYTVVRHRGRSPKRGTKSRRRYKWPKYKYGPPNYSTGPPITYYKPTKQYLPEFVNAPKYAPIEEIDFSSHLNSAKHHYDLHQTTTTTNTNYEDQVMDLDFYSHGQSYGYDAPKKELPSYTVYTPSKTEGKRLRSSYKKPKKQHYSSSYGSSGGGSLYGSDDNDDESSFAFTPPESTYDMHPMGTTTYDDAPSYSSSSSSSSSHDTKGYDFTSYDSNSQSGLHIPATTYGVPDVTLPVLYAPPAKQKPQPSYQTPKPSPVESYVVYEKKIPNSGYSGSKGSSSAQYNFAEPPPSPHATPTQHTNIEITYSPSYEINLPPAQSNYKPTVNKYPPAPGEFAEPPPPPKHQPHPHHHPQPPSTSFKPPPPKKTAHRPRPPPSSSFKHKPRPPPPRDSYHPQEAPAPPSYHVPEAPAPPSYHVPEAPAPPPYHPPEAPAPPSYHAPEAPAPPSYHTPEAPAPPPYHPPEAPAPPSYHALDTHPPTSSYQDHDANAPSSYENIDYQSPSFDELPEPHAPPSFHNPDSHDAPPTAYQAPESPTDSYEVPDAQPPSDYSAGNDESSDEQSQSESDYNNRAPHAEYPQPDYVSPSQDLPINWKYMPPAYNFPKSSYEVPIYDPIPFEASSAEEHETFPPHNFDNQHHHTNDGQAQSGSSPIATANAPSSTTTSGTSKSSREPSKRRKRLRNSTPTITTKHVLDATELEEAYEANHGRQTEDDDDDDQTDSSNNNNDADVNESNHVAAKPSNGPPNYFLPTLAPKTASDEQSYIGPPWNPVRIRGAGAPMPALTLGRGKAQPPAAAPTATNTSKAATASAKGRRQQASRTNANRQQHAATTAGFTPMQGGINKTRHSSTTSQHSKGGGSDGVGREKVEIVSIDKSRSYSYYDGTSAPPSSTSKEESAYRTRQQQRRRKQEQPPHEQQQQQTHAPSHKTRQLVTSAATTTTTTEQNTEPHRITKSVFETTYFNSPRNKNLQRHLEAYWGNLPKNHKWF